VVSKFAAQPGSKVSLLDDLTTSRRTATNFPAAVFQAKGEAGNAAGRFLQMPSVIRAGAPDELAIEAHPEHPVDPQWVHGRFCLLVHGNPLGDPDDVAMLRGIAAWWRSFVEDEPPRWDERLADLPPDAAFELLHDAAFGDEPRHPVPDAFRFFVGHLGMSAFGAYDVVVIDDPGGRQRLLWRHGASPVHEAVFEPRRMQRVGRAFLAAWVAASLPL
jgi:hypothetical protein